ncbi:hypothetical protein RQP46_011222 [Phenoliferia psychrophenolica]
MATTATTFASTYNPVAGDWILFDPEVDPGRSNLPLRKQAIGQIYRSGDFKIRRYLRARELPNDACRAALLSQEKEVVQGLLEHVSRAQVLGRCAVQHHDDYETGVPAPPYWDSKTPLYFSRTGFNSSQLRVENRSKGAWIGSVHRDTSQYVILPRQSTKRRSDSTMEDESPAPFKKRNDVDLDTAEANMIIWFVRRYSVEENQHHALQASAVWGTYVKAYLPKLPPLSFGRFLRVIESSTRVRYTGNYFQSISRRPEKLDLEFVKWALRTYTYSADSCVSFQQIEKDYLADEATPDETPDDNGIEDTVMETFGTFGRTALLEGPHGITIDSVVQGVRHKVVPPQELEEEDDNEDAEGEDDDIEEAVEPEQAVIVLPPPPKEVQPATPLPAVAIPAHASSSSSAPRTDSTAATSPSVPKRDRNIVKISLTAFISHMKRIDPHRSVAHWDEAHKILADALVGPDVLQELGMVELKALGLKSK